MAANENEEFEFRLRAEREAAVAKPVAAVPATTTPESKPYGDRNPLTGVAEGALGIGTGALAAPVAGLAGIGAGVGNALGLTKTDPADVVAKTADTLTYKPRSKIGQAGVNMVAYPFEKLAQGAQAASDKVFDVTGSPLAATHVNATLQSIPLLAGRGPARLSRTVKADAPAARTPTGAGADVAVNELQTQRQIMSGKEPVRDLNSQSAYEAAVVDRDAVTTPLRNEAFRSRDKVETAPTLKLINELEARNPDRVVRAALKEVRGTIERAIDASKASGLPAAGARLSVDDLKALQGQSGRMDVAMADEVRQSIKRMTETKGEKALDKHTQDLLGQVRDKFLEGTPESYKKYLAEYSRLSKPLDEFKAAGSILEKVTADPAAFHLLNPADKQLMMQAAFNGKTPGRVLSELVRDTEHNPQALQGVREAYADFLSQPETITKLPTAKGLIERWENTKEAARSSKLMSEDHIATMDKIMDDVRQAEQKGGIKRAAASVAGWILGSKMGHPYVGASTARDIVVGTNKGNTRKALENATMRIAADPNGAQALALPPTPANVAKVVTGLPTDIAAIITLPSAQSEQLKKRNRNPLALEFQP